jgi:hypothetical protein
MRKYGYIIVLNIQHPTHEVSLQGNEYPIMKEKQKAKNYCHVEKHKNRREH